MTFRVLQQEIPLYSQLGIQKGITAVIGSGGKTTLLSVLARELPGTVLLCTSTHIRPFAEAAQVLFEEDGGKERTSGPQAKAGDTAGHRATITEEEAAARIREALAVNRIVCTGTKTADGKLTAPPVSFEALETLAEYVLMEADGARGLPLKAHAPHEPVIPRNSRQVICVAGAQGFDRPAKEVVHRPEIFCNMLNTQGTGEGVRDIPVTPDTIVTPQLAGEALRLEHLADTLFINQADTAERQRDAGLCAAYAGMRQAFAGAAKFFLVQYACF
ncbi:MAG: putative selenium-dependent hydroxylase accessory protein YqeC [Lachnospiraceae bacterium]|nr:putative selenium-dependent hydroxylase accessory protein YqeC [Lachnospiraceae bacterium]